MLLQLLYDAIKQPYLAIRVPYRIIKPYRDMFLQCPMIDNPAGLEKNKFDRDGLGEWHITVVNAMEYAKLSPDEKRYGYGPIHDIYVLGIGKALNSTSVTYFLVCKSEGLANIRANLNLPDMDFHITMGFDPKDVFRVPKNETTIIAPIEGELP